MPDKPRATMAHEFLAPRTIVVSGRAALFKAPGSDDRERIKDRVTEFLSELESAVIRDGAKPELIALLEEARREVRSARFRELAQATLDMPATLQETDYLERRQRSTWHRSGGKPSSEAAVNLSR